MPSEQMPRDHAQAIGLALKQAREAKGESLAEAAFRIALSPSQLRAIESADTTPFYSASYYRQAVERYASFLGVSLAEMATDASSSADVTAAVTAAVTESVVTESSVTEAVVTEAPSAERTTSTDVTTSTTQTSTTDTGQDTPLSLREKLGNGPDVPPPHEPRSRLGWIALIAAVVIALGVVKVAMEKPSVAPAAAVQTPAVVNDAAEKASETPVSPSPATGTTAVTPAPAAPVTSPSAVKPAAPVTPPPTAKPATTPTSVVPARGADSQLESKVTTWVQIVKSNGEKSNLKMEPGQKIEFVSGDTAAVVFGQPDQASLKVKGRAVNLKPFVTQENPSRALVILNQIRE